MKINASIFAAAVLVCAASAFAKAAPATIGTGLIRYDEDHGVDTDKFENDCRPLVRAIRSEVKAGSSLNVEMYIGQVTKSIGCSGDCPDQPHDIVTVAICEAKLTANGASVSIKSEHFPASGDQCSAALSGLTGDLQSAYQKGSNDCVVDTVTVK